MPTFAELSDRVRLVADNAGINLTIDVDNLVREAENIFIEETFCTQDVYEIDTSSEGLSDVYAVPTGFVKDFRATWNGVKIDPVHQKSDVRLRNSANSLITGTPVAYWIEDEQVRLVPKPASNGYFHLWYCKRNTASDGASPIIPTREHIKLIDYVLFVVFDMDGREQKAANYEKRFYAKAADAKRRYKNERFKQETITDVLGDGHVEGLSLQNRIGLISET